MWGVGKIKELKKSLEVIGLGNWKIGVVIFEDQERSRFGREYHQELCSGHVTVEMPVKNPSRIHESGFRDKVRGRYIPLGSNRCAIYRGYQLAHHRYLPQPHEVGSCELRSPQVQAYYSLEVQGSSCL